MKRVRIAKHNDDRVRVVLDLLDDDLSYDDLPMENPFRLVVDVSRMGNKKKPKPNYFVDGADASLGLVVIDPGHGGKDSGAIGVKGLKEKDVCLQLAISLAEELRSRNVKVELTRESDVFVPLEQRAALANQLGADLFLSVHANALEDQGVAGVETYYLDMTDDRYALRLASVENQINEEKVSEIQLHLANLANQLSTEGSRELAGMIHKAAFRAMRLSAPAITKDLGVKSSLFYVLLGTRMPAVLLEAGFITNPRQAQVLKNRRYGKKLSRELADGILAFLKKRETKYATE